MKKNHPQQNPEALYAQVKKPGRRQPSPQQTESLDENVNTGRRGPRPEDVVYAQVNTGGHRGQREPRPEDIVYAQVNTGGHRGQREPRPEDIVYAQVNTGGHRGQREPRPEDIVYAQVNTGGNRGQRGPSPEDVVYAQVNTGGNRGQREPRPEDIVYAQVNTGGHRGQRGPSPEDVVYAQVSPGGHRGQRGPRSEDIVYAQVRPQQARQHSLSNEEILEKTAGSPLVKAYREEIQYWCKKVYGNKNILQEKMDSVLKNPAMGEQLSWDVAANPRSVHKLAGYNICGLKTSARRQAEESLQHLCSAIDNYTNAVQGARETLMHTPRAEQKRRGLTQEVTQHVQQARERQQTAPEQHRQPRKQTPQKGMAFAM
ncbi:hypothetical protein HNQ69_001120 [Bartonella callosciuri]|uniref:Uncharacterized protein n=1 Tax=Bartonella callosciuri TaxID=686223 RepID=A0A840P121_9HYPH|nr:BID domain-containing T4SS effector [Bartonella callosciuri]MBB5073987.1 hypothetical protein [Bartonella callosciuri]